MSTLLDWLRREGIEIRSGGKLSTEDMLEVRRLRSDGWSHQRIAEQFGVTRSAVSLRLSRER
ncbi:MULTISPECIES: helix-turn-helix domain-containing protein [Aeromicrobium]